MRIFKLEDKYYCIADKEFSYEKLEENIKLELKMRDNSFAYSYSLKIIRDLFEYVKDLKQEYIDFYSEEYEDFTLYLYQKKLMGLNTIQSLAIGDDQTLLRLRMNMSNYNASSLIEHEDDKLELLNELLEEVNT